MKNLFLKNNKGLNVIQHLILNLLTIVILFIIIYNLCTSFMDTSTFTSFCDSPPAMDDSESAINSEKNSSILFATSLFVGIAYVWIFVIIPSGGVSAVLGLKVLKTISTNLESSPHIVDNPVSTETQTNFNNVNMGLQTMKKIGSNDAVIAVKKMNPEQITKTLEEIDTNKILEFISEKHVFFTKYQAGIIDDLNNQTYIIALIRELVKTLQKTSPTNMVTEFESIKTAFFMDIEGFSQTQKTVVFEHMINIISKQPKAVSPIKHHLIEIMQQMDVICGENWEVCCQMAETAGIFN